jgi:hypothetical protein
LNFKKTQKTYDERIEMKEEEEISKNGIKILLETYE